MLIVDTGVLRAAADNTDRAHTACVDLVETTSNTLITTAVVAETSYMIERQLGPVADARDAIDTQRHRYPTPSRHSCLRRVLLVTGFGG